MKRIKEAYVMKRKHENQNLAPLKSGPLSKKNGMVTIGSLEAGLLKQFPASDAQSWDHTGLLVGDPAMRVIGVAVCLDPTVDAITKAREAGANVIVSHHPAYREAPVSFSPIESVPLSPGSAVWAAIENNVALLSYHTALDVSREAAQVLPGLLHLAFNHIVDPIDEKGQKGYGQFCSVHADDKPYTLGKLAARTISIFGRYPRVWGDFDRRIEKVVTCTGSAGDMAARALKSGADVLICGEIRYHDALAASQAGLSVIDLGHDVSELPLVASLVAAVEKCGVPDSNIVVVDQGSNWHCPETVRM